MTDSENNNNNNNNVKNNNENNENNENKELINWDDLNCKPEILRGIYAYGFENPSPIQKKELFQLYKEKIL